MDEQPKPTKKTNISMRSFMREVDDQSEVYVNVSQKYVVTTEDKIKLCLSKHLKHAEKRRSWLTPLSILIALIATLATSSFKASLGLSAEVWSAVFHVIGAIVFVWLVVCVCVGLTAKGVEDIVEELKKTRT